jgi:hypothetical protein
MSSEEIPSAIQPYFKEIADKLLNSRAALMVGAGFSRNAEKSHAQQRDLPTWIELGDIFFEKIHGEMPGSNARYLNMLKLAEEIDVIYGRAVLNELLITHIPDKEYSPSKLHEKLLELNWSDVFTTNYDTLLERACEYVFARRYDIVINQEDLVYSQKPRIVKLHGTFPSQRPLIISESDYRMYPKKFAPFINTVQQALIENILCLIGFSADDPNFLQWITWIHDNLGKENSPKIYMIGLFNFSERQRRNLEAKNIIPVDLSCYQDCEGSHFKALDRFLDDLSNFQSKDKINWPIGYLKNNYYRDKNFKEVIISWQLTRLNYPNWVILPEENRESLWNFTSGAAAHIEEVLEAEKIVDIEYCYELNWRLEKCLCPLIDDVEKTFYKVFKKYSFFGLSHGDSIHQNELWIEDSAVVILQEKWLDLGIAVLRSLRERGNLISWRILYQQLLSISNHFSPELLAKFSYERALYSLSSHDYLTLWEDLESWPRNENLPYWEAKRAGLLVEVGQSKESLRILDKSLHYVRRHMSLNRDGDNYLWQSQEAYIMYLEFCINKNVQIKLSSRSDREYWRRWDKLASYKCDPRSEWRLFEKDLKREFITWNNKSEKEAFDIGFTNRNFSNSENVEILKAYSFIRFLEETGFPLNLTNYSVRSKIMAGSLNRIVDYSPYLVVSLLSRYNDVNLVRDVLGRDQIAKIEIDNIDILIENHLNVFIKVLPNIHLKNTAELFVSRMPEILSRFCVRCSEESKTKIFDFICSVYKSEVKTNKIGVLFRRLMESSSNLIKQQTVAEFLNVPLDLIDNEYFPEPLQFVEVVNSSLEDLDIRIPEWQVVKLFEQSGCGQANRQEATFRLLKLNELNLLDPLYAERLHCQIWSCVDEIGYPADINFDRRYVLENSTLSEGDAKAIFKTHLFSREFVSDSTGSLSIYAGRIDLVRDFIWISKTLDNLNGIVWTVNELSEIIDKLLGWWNKDKRLIGKFDKTDDNSYWMSGSEELKGRFKNIIDLIVKIMPMEPTLPQEGDVFSKLVGLVDEMEENNVPVLRARASFASVLNTNIDDLLSELERGIMQKDDYVIVDAFDAILFFTSYHKDNEQLRGNVERAIQLLLSPLRWDMVPQKRYAASIAAEIIRYIPEIDLKFAFPTLLKYLDRELLGHRQQQTTSALAYLKNDVKLASSLYQRYECSDDSIPSILEEWKEFVFNREQFADITNSWK